MKAFFDTNVLMSAAHSPGGVCRELLVTLSGNETRGLETLSCWASERVLDELVRNLVLKMRYAPSHAARKMEEFEAVLRMAAAATAPVACDDKADGWILADAAGAQCDYFVTGDRLVLGLYAIDTMRIVTPREALDWLAMGKPIPRFEAHEERAAYLERRLESVV